jgi:hypothetical protein
MPFIEFPKRIEMVSGKYSSLEIRLRDELFLRLVLPFQNRLLHENYPGFYLRLPGVRCMQAATKHPAG